MQKNATIIIWRSVPTYQDVLIQNEYYHCAVKHQNCLLDQKPVNKNFHKTWVEFCQRTNWQFTRTIKLFGQTVETIFGESSKRLIKRREVHLKQGRFRQRKDVWGRCYTLSDDKCCMLPWWCFSNWERLLWKCEWKLKKVCFSWPPNPVSRILN